MLVRLRSPLITVLGRMVAVEFSHHSQNIVIVVTPGVMLSKTSFPLNHILFEKKEREISKPGHPPKKKPQPRAITFSKIWYFTIFA